MTSRLPSANRLEIKSGCNQIFKNQLSNFAFAFPLSITLLNTDLDSANIESVQSLTENGHNLS